METTDDRSLSVKVVAAVFLPVASVAVILRCYVRLRIVRAFGWDDGMMVFALVCLPPRVYGLTDLSSSFMPCSQRV